ncbi:MAG TPA: carboxypeptidase regulatory-like domain-containing protein [Vicinamibacterales bacterium]|nr:carboxypeptidase regulatory-like domain-containing protein [Vicinamibacterales bacterium]
MRGPVWPLVVWLILAGPVAVFAADTGSVSGAVFDQNGTPVAEAMVTISGDHLPVGRTVLTGPNGTYRLEYLLPGEYSVAIEKAGVGTARRAAVVEVGKDTQLDFVVGITLSEEVSATAATPAVDVRSTEVSFNVKSETFNTLPLERSYRGLLQLIPGVGDNRSTVGPVAGGSRQDNTYLMDGANITNPGFGYLSTEVSELDIAEVNFKRAAISAEFGRTAGAVTNAVSRSGSNRFAGIGRIDWLSKDLVGGYSLPDDLLASGVKPGTFRDPMLTTEAGPAVGIGGPVVHDHVFFYGSARYGRQTKWDRVNKVATPLPDEVRSTGEFFGKITAVPASTHQLNVSFRFRPSEVADAGLDSTTDPSVATDTDNPSQIASADWAFFMSARQALNLRYLYMRDTNEDTPVTDLGYLPPFNPNSLSTMGQYTDPQQADLRVGANQFSNTQNYRRHEVRATFSQFFDLAKTSHALKAGVGYEFGEEELNRLANGWGLISNLTVNGAPALRTRYFTPQPPQLGQGRSYGIFVQDSVTLTSRATVNAGVLFSRDDFMQELAGSHGCPATIPLQGGAAVYESSGDTCTFLRFGFTDQVQPRLGVSYQVRPDTHDKAYASWGRYSNMDQKSTGRSLAPNRVFMTQTVFDLAGNVLSSGPLASSTGKLIDPAIEPIYTNEFVVGYATPLAGAYSVDVYFVSRDMHNFIEDVPSRINGPGPTDGPYVAANLPCVAFAACQNADAQRTYRALTVDVRRQLTGRWMSATSYTWSRFEGNYDIDFGQVAAFNTSSLIQDGPGANVEDPNRFGPLFEDRPHVLKVFTTYTATTRLTVAGYLRVQSGTPWAARGKDWTGSTLNFLEPSGSHRNPVWTNLDLLSSYRLPVGGPASISVEARLLNVIGNQTRLSTDALEYLDLPTTSSPPYFGPYLQPNPFFGTGNAFAPPRRLHLAAVVSF